MGFSNKNLELLSKSLQVANLPSNATEIVKYLKTFKIWVFIQKIDGFSEKNLVSASQEFCKIYSPFFEDCSLNFVAPVRTLSKIAIESIQPLS